MVSENIRKTSPYLGRNLIPSFGAAFLAANVTGIVAGIWLRVLMGIIAAVFPEMASGLTLGGVFFLLLTGVGFSLANSLLFTLAEPILPKRTLFKGLLYGTINLLLFGTPFFLSNPGNELFGPQAPLAVLLFSILFLLTGFLLAVLHSYFITWRKHAIRRMVLFIAFIVFIVPTLIIFGGSTYEFFDETIPDIWDNLSASKM